MFAAMGIDRETDALVVLEDFDNNGPDAVLAAEFAARARAPVASTFEIVEGQTASIASQELRAGGDGTQANRRQPQPAVGNGQDTCRAARDDEDEEIPCSLPDGMSDESPGWDSDEEMRLLEAFEATAVDVSVPVFDVSAQLRGVSSADWPSQSNGVDRSQARSGSSRPSRPPDAASRLVSDDSAAQRADSAGPSGSQAVAATSRGPCTDAGKENQRPRPQQPSLGIQLARRSAAEAAGAGANFVGSGAPDEAAIRSQESAQLPLARNPKRRQLKRLYSPDPDLDELDDFDAEPAAAPKRACTPDEAEEVIDLDCDEDAAPAASDWCLDAQPPSEDAALRLSPVELSLQSGRPPDAEDSGEGVERPRPSQRFGSSLQFSGDSLGNNSLKFTQVNHLTW